VLHPAKIIAAKIQLFFKTTTFLQFFSKKLCKCSGNFVILHADFVLIFKKMITFDQLKDLLEREQALRRYL